MYVSYRVSILIMLITICSNVWVGYCFIPFLSRKKVVEKNRDGKPLSKIPESIRAARCGQFSEFLQSNRRFGGEIFGSAIRYISNFLVGLIFSFIMRVLNKLTVFRRDILIKEVFHRQKGKGLLTYSNHQSMSDDPGIWAALLPWWRMHPEQSRWALCTEDVFFSSPVITAIMGAGNVIPLDRAGSIDQPLLERFCEKVKAGKWGHIFPEGRVWQNWRFLEGEPKLGKFKAGIGKVITHCFPNDPTVLPIFHAGFDKVIPEKVLSAGDKFNPSSPRTAIPQGGGNLRVFVGTPISFHEKIEKFNSQYPEELKSWRTTIRKIQLYREITEELRQRMLALESEAYNPNPTSKDDMTTKF